MLEALDFLILIPRAAPGALGVLPRMPGNGVVTVTGAIVPVITVCTERRSGMPRFRRSRMRRGGFRGRGRRRFGRSSFRRRGRAGFSRRVKVGFRM